MIIPFATASNSSSAIWGPWKFMYSFFGNSRCKQKDYSSNMSKRQHESIHGCMGSAQWCVWGLAGICLSLTWIIVYICIYIYTHNTIYIHKYPPCVLPLKKKNRAQNIGKIEGSYWCRQMVHVIKSQLSVHWDDEWFHFLRDAGTWKVDFINGHSTSQILHTPTTWRMIFIHSYRRTDLQR